MSDKFITIKSGGMPLYQQFANNLREQINGGGIDPGNALPSERELCEMTGMSRVTVRKAIDTLIDEGLLFRKQGSGTFVASRIQAPLSYPSSFSDDARQRGEDPGVIWMIKSVASATEEEMTALAIPASARVARLGRVRLAGGVPLAIEHAVIPAQFLPALDQLGDSLYETLGARGYRPVKGTQRIRASLATPTEAAMLCIAENSEVLRIERRTQLADGVPVEFTRSVYRGDVYEFVSELDFDRAPHK